MDETQLPVGPAYRRCIEPTKVDNERPCHSRSIIPPPRIGQASTLGIAMRRAPPGESEGACTTSAGSPERINHEYPAIAGVRESVHETSMNLKEIALAAAHPSAAQEAHIPIVGPGKVAARDTVPPPSIGIIYPAQHAATVTRKIRSSTGSRVEGGCGYRRRNMVEYQKGSPPPDAVSMPIRNANYSIHRLGSHGGGIMKEMPPPEARTDGSPTPGEASSVASRDSANLFFFSPFHRSSLNASTHGRRRRRRRRKYA
uniref:RNA polymerase alpha subunit n=1 Tax=Selaginella bisulcata TaxID=1715365 RepID=A0A482CFJ9_9TRAC|nr:RNA polymerase alpha subunit [Selaginella bisulcata]QBL75975.1 RNA polymerase alpha subunit [Selaginella bisulcata]